MHVPSGILMEAWDIYRTLLLGGSWSLNSVFPLVRVSLKPLHRSFSFSSYHFPSEFLRIFSCTNTVQRLTKHLREVNTQIWRLLLLWFPPFWDLFSQSSATTAVHKYSGFLLEIILHALDWSVCPSPPGGGDWIMWVLPIITASYKCWITSQFWLLLDFFQWLWTGDLYILSRIYHCSW